MSRHMLFLWCWLQSSWRDWATWSSEKSERFVKECSRFCQKPECRGCGKEAHKRRRKAAEAGQQQMEKQSCENNWWSGRGNRRRSSWSSTDRSTPSRVKKTTARTLMEKKDRVWTRTPSIDQLQGLLDLTFSLCPDEDRTTEMAECVLHQESGSSEQSRMASEPGWRVVHSPRKEKLWRTPEIMLSPCHSSGKLRRRMSSTVRLKLRSWRAQSVCCRKAATLMLAEGERALPQELRDDESFAAICGHIAEVTERVPGCSEKAVSDATTARAAQERCRWQQRNI